MTWKVGQTVGQASGSGKLRRLTIERVTPSGRASVNREYYSPNGRPIGGYLRRGSIFVWTDAHESTWLAQESKRIADEAAASKAKNDARRRRNLDRQAIDFGLRLLSHAPVGTMTGDELGKLERFKALVLQYARPQGDFESMESTS